MTCAIADPTREDALGELTKIVYSPGAAANGPEAYSAYRMIYWLWSATETDLTTSEALQLIAQRAGQTASESTQRQVMAVWQVAATNGLLTRANLERMRQNLAPTATVGRYAGRPFVTTLLDPRAGHQVTNVTLVPSGQPLPPEPATNTNSLADGMGAGRPLPPAMQGPGVPGFYPGRNAPIPANMPARTNTASGTQIDARRGYPPAFAPVPSPAVQPSGSTEEPTGHIEVNDVPLNGLLPLGGSTKLGIARVTDTEITYSIVGEKQTYQGPSVYAYTPSGSAMYSGGAYHPSVRPHKVSKTNPVRLPNLSGNAYLLFIDQGAKYYYLDVSVDNGAVFRIVEVSGAP